ncbi:DNA-3-methyladenine glycosylase I, partial [Akkermansiaceae bacterium]|nr:DNA-3-methyladenine glycosylase I [Akkermansiaceae bacterium]
KNFRAGFAGFDFKKVASFGDGDVERLMQDAGIVRHRGKILSTINNAKQAIELTQEFGSLYEYFQTYRPEVRPERCDFSTLSQITKTDESTAMSKDLKKRGWSFVGPTTCYAFMQAMGLVNDHIEGCFMREQLKKISLPETGSEKS